MHKFEKRILLSPPHMSGNEMQYIQKAFDDNWVVPLGPNVDRFEKDIATYLQEQEIYPIATSSGTAAIHIALRLLNLQEKEEVFCSSSTFIASANPVMYEKAVPIFIDSEKDTWNICPASLLRAIEEKKKTGKIPRVLICADLFGMSARYDEITDICNSYGISIISDAAEALGSSYKNRKCGTLGNYGVLSFNGNKIITTSGGGMLITHSKEEANKALFLITQARDQAPYYLHSEIGYNYRMSNILAGIGIAQLQVLDSRVEARRNVYSSYKNYLVDTPLIFLDEPEGYRSNRWLSTALIPDNTRISASQLIAHLNEYNIEARRIWNPMHKQPIFEKNEFFHTESKPISEYIFQNGICLPSGSNMPDDTVYRISEIIKLAFQ
ncbi:DegT/DnrJ/EryC1/StrS family aminotransferase [Pseudobdellovibrio exovorus]|uniref:Putative aminotransferase n=1 Tax=Pseudobdellovibrio exovorus JSS TaxID=1184267 RepID=M4VCC0_9BACT|nr:DegT/DnrJ/EryC1/StrS family aminotransferase [Pseudobdellovibrio exovorus]AGH95681.1 putative aminotransferase [Pseudobdellovibrio exovorus JSS]